MNQGLDGGMEMENFLSPTFVIGTIKIDQVEGASCVNMGNNWPTNFRSYKKHNQGFGTVKGNHNVLKGARSLLNDPDTYDMLSVTESQLSKVSNSAEDGEPQRARNAP
ncbi:hypothetical protein LLE49_03205 [Alicyclobacillus tolerans]|uniref:hypothetical protein n=1 Tax=Alicyclobacillus tolerans TaxID=90970 RepID=UPI001F3AF2BC|nr:hypothetical protein [Alicyclobacillus tolerans]MCF8563746.1 hypothetical protein [Alicyclobacillus tolerans]